MLKLVNEELMAFSTINVMEKGKPFTKIKVATSNKLQQYENDSRNNRNGDKEPAKSVPSAKVNIVSNVDKLKPINREIIRISTSLKNIAEFESQPDESKTVDFDLPMNVNVTTINDRQQNVEVRCHENGDDRANLYVIAFPFNGMIKPIPENPQYRIYKGLIASSAKPFFFNNRKYRKVLYLVIEINKNLFNADHKYHTDKISIKLESYALFKDKETDTEKTNCETFILDILSADGDYTTSWDYNTADEPIMMVAAPGQQLWVTYDMRNRNAGNRSTSSDRSSSNRSFNKSQKPVTIEGNMKVTINKHGIRKEIPIKNDRQRNNRNSRYDKDIDQMMKESGMFESEYDNRGKRNGGKRTNRNGRNKGRF